VTLPQVIITPQDLRLGLVIGSYAAVPYVHLQLETRKRLYPHVPMLVQDDGSPCQGILRDLCSSYGVDFQSNPVRFPVSGVGDLRVYSAGLEWAHARGITLLYKFSRRFLPLTDWSEEATALALASQAATYSSSCTRCGYGFRTECIGFHVETWFRLGMYDNIQSQVSRHEQHFVEGYMHNNAKTAIGKVCLQHSQWVLDHPMPDDRAGYAQPVFMGVNRFAPNPFALWHDADPPERYYRRALELGIQDYTMNDFNDPNRSPEPTNHLLGGLFAKHGSDKCSYHSYDVVYDDLFHHLRSKPLNLLEVGVLEGSSLNAFAEYFRTANIFGLDINPEVLKRQYSARVIVKQGDSTNTREVQAALGDIRFDIIIDDGEHHLSVQERTYATLIHYLRPGGIYIVEDVQNIDEAINANFLRDFICLDRRRLKGRWDDVIMVYKKPL
jgi:hypothetical protein